MTFTTLVPTCRNDGSPVEQVELDEIVEGLWRQFGGLSIEGTVTGHWVDAADDRHYQDTSLKVTVACDTSRMAEAEEAVIAIGRRLGQVAMYFEVRYADGVRFLLVE
jgi:hypothetical protein